MKMEDSKKTNITESDLVKYQDNYSEPKLWDKLKKFAAKLGEHTTYYILVLYYVLQSPEVSLANKSMIIGALGYFILPVDLIPDLIPIMGFTDDVAALTLAYNAIKSSITTEIEARAKARLAEWFK